MWLYYNITFNKYIFISSHRLKLCVEISIMLPILDAISLDDINNKSIHLTIV